MATQPTLMEYIGIAPASGLELAELVERGLPTSNLDYLKAKGLTFTEMAAVVISPRTLKHRKARGENLTPEETPRAVRVASTIRLAVQVLETTTSPFAGCAAQMTALVTGPRLACYRPKQEASLSRKCSGASMKASTVDVPLAHQQSCRAHRPGRRTLAGSGLGIICSTHCIRCGGDQGGMGAAHRLR